MLAQNVCQPHDTKNLVHMGFMHNTLLLTLPFLPPVKNVTYLWNGDSEWTRGKTRQKNVCRKKVHTWSRIAHLSFNALLSCFRPLISRQQGVQVFIFACLPFFKKGGIHAAFISFFAFF